MKINCSVLKEAEALLLKASTRITRSWENIILFRDTPESRCALKVEALVSRMCHSYVFIKINGAPSPSLLLLPQWLNGRMVWYWFSELSLSQTTTIYKSLLPLPLPPSCLHHHHSVRALTLLLSVVGLPQIRAAVCHTSSLCIWVSLEISYYLSISIWMINVPRFHSDKVFWNR